MTNIYTKPTDFHQYLDRSSSYANYIASPCELEGYVHLKVTVWVTAIKRNHDFLKKAIQKTFDEEMKKVEFSGKDINESKGAKEVPFVVTYHPSLNCLSRIIN